MPDLSRLSEAERKILLLLARGHTAKSAGTVLDLTEGAVNERLREARRKTGAGSSRELARRAAAQESRDNKFGVADPVSGGDTGHRSFPLRARWPVLLGAVCMSILASAIGAFAVLAVAGHPAPSPSKPPRVVATSPAVGAQLAAGKIVLKVTFDQPMAPGYSFIARDRASYPTCAPKPTQSADRRSFTLGCVVEPGKAYWIGFNNARFRNFTSVDGVAAVPASLSFSAH